MRNCPFCGKEVKGEYPYLEYLEATKHWSLSHYCNPGLPLTVAIHVYGDTAEEVIDRWNGGAVDGKEHSAK